MADKGTPDLLFQEALRRLKTGYGLGVHRENWKHTGAQRIRFQSDMLKAQRFVLDRSFIRAAVAASTLEPKLLAKRLSLMRPPFPYTWIEWDETIRMDALTELGFLAPASRKHKNTEEDFSAEQVGVLLMQEWDTAIMKTNGEPVGRLAHSYSMQPVVRTVIDGKDIIDCSGLSIGWKDTPIVDPTARPETAAASLSAALGFHYPKKTGVPADEHHPLAPYVAAGLGGPFASVTVRAVMHDKKKNGSDMIDAMVRATAGDWRFVAAVLLLWSVRGPVLKSAGEGSAVQRAGLGPIGDETKVTQMQAGAPRYEAAEAGGSRASPREYTYQGHWCFSHKTPGKKWWRNAGTRGNRQRGMIQKVYQAKGPQPT